MKMEKINEKSVDGMEKMLNGGGGGGNMKTMLKPTTKSSSSGTMINGTIHEELEAHMNPCNYLMVDELGVAGNPIMPTAGDPDSAGGGGGPFAIKQKLQSGNTQNGTGNLIQIPIPMHHRSSRSIRSLKRPQPQPHICILDKTVDNLDVYINVLSWTRIVKPEKTNDPIPLYGGMRVMSGSVTYKPLLIYAVTVNPIVLENTKRLCGNTTAQQSLMTLMVDFVEAMNPDLKLKRQPKILIDRDLTGELKEIWLALHSKRERDKFRVLEESYYLYEEFGPPGSATTPPSLTNESDEQNDDSGADDGRVALDTNAQSDSITLNSLSSSQDKTDHKELNSDCSSTPSSVPFTKKPTVKGNECDNKIEKKIPATESTTTSTPVKGSPASSSSPSTSGAGGGKLKSPSDDVTPSPQTTAIQNTKNRTSHIPILGIKDNKDNKENKEKEKRDKSGGDQSPIQRSIDFLAGISFFKSKNHENGASGSSNVAAGHGNSSNSNHSADSNNHKSNGGNIKKKDKNSNSSSSNSKQQTSSKQQQHHGVRNSSNVINDSSNTGRSDKINNSSSNSSNSIDDGGE